jgi:hypothetical protein
MSMDGDYQKNDATYDSINKKLVLAIVLIAVVVIGAWYYLSGL